MGTAEETRVAEHDLVGADPVGATESAKPRLRGVFHQVAFFVSLVSGAALVWAAPTTASTVAVLIYAVSISLLFGVSALFHRHTLSLIHI